MTWAHEISLYSAYLNNPGIRSSHYIYPINLHFGNFFLFIIFAKFHNKQITIWDMYGTICIHIYFVRTYGHIYIYITWDQPHINLGVSNKMFEKYFTGPSLYVLMSWTLTLSWPPLLRLHPPFCLCQIWMVSLHIWTFNLHCGRPLRYFHLSLAPCLRMS